MLNGLGLHKATAFKVNIYVAAPYVAKPTNDSRAILAWSAPNELILQFVRGVRANDRKRALEAASGSDIRPSRGAGCPKKEGLCAM